MRSNPSSPPAIAATALSALLASCNLGDYESGVANSRTEVAMDREAAKTEVQKAGDKYRRMLQRLKIGEKECPEIASLYEITADSKVNQMELANAVEGVESIMEQPASERVLAYRQMGRNHAEMADLSEALECHELLEIIALSDATREEAEALLVSGKYTPLQVLASVEKPGQ